MNTPAFPFLPPSTRRALLARAAYSLGGLGLASFLQSRAQAETIPDSPLGQRPPHFAPRAKRVIQIFCVGGPSQVDTFDPKPALTKFHGRLVDDVVKDYQQNAGAAAAGPKVGRLSGKLQRSGFKFSKHGQCGTEISELFPRLADHADKLCVVRSMHTKTSVHEPAQLMLTCGEFASVRPSIGSWIVYGLGSENQNLPGFVALSPGGSETTGDKMWSSAFLPAWCAGTGIPTKDPSRDPSVAEMLEHIRSGTTSLREQRRQLDLLHAMHDEFAVKHPGDALLGGRMSAFETAFRMQIEATDAFDLAREPKSIRDLYGNAQQSRQLLLARRLVERGVRYVQVYHGGWDTHEFNDEHLPGLCSAADHPLHALLTDLQQRDMLKDTLVLWGGEFGRTPTTDNNNPNRKTPMGRDHNATGFTIWMAGGGTRPGTVYGSTDDFGAVAMENKVEVHDLHATILHLMGLNHEKLTYRHSGRDFRLTDVYGHVVDGLIA
jgi:hypothetical protein